MIIHALRGRHHSLATSSLPASVFAQRRGNLVLPLAAASSTSAATTDVAKVANVATAWHSALGNSRLGLGGLCSFGGRSSIASLGGVCSYGTKTIYNPNSSSSSSNNNTTTTATAAPSTVNITEDMFIKASQDGKVGLIGMYIYELDKAGSTILAKHHEYYLQACVSAKDPQRALSYMNSLNESQLTESAYVVGLRACRQGKNVNIANLMVNRLSTHIQPENISLRVWVELMKTYGANSDYKSAMSILDKLNKYGSIDSLYKKAENSAEALMFYNGLLSVYCSCGKGREFSDTIGLMKQLDIKFNAETWILQIRNAARTKDSKILIQTSNMWCDEIRSTMRAVASDSSPVTPKSANINNSVGQSGQNGSVIDLFEEYSNNNVINEIFSGFKYQINNFGALEMYSTLSQIEGMSKYYSSNDRTFTLLLNICCNGYNVKSRIEYLKSSVQAILVDMHKHQVPLREKMWTKYIFPVVYESDLDINSLQSIMKIYQSNSSIIPEFLYRSLITLYVKKKNIQMAINCLDDIKEGSRRDPSVETYCHLVKLLSQGDNWDTCLSVFRSIRSSGSCASREMWSILLTSVSSNRLTPLTLIHNMVLEMIEEDDIHPDAVMWSDVIKEIQSRDSRDYHLQRYQFSMIHGKNKSSSVGGSGNVSGINAGLGGSSKLSLGSGVGSSSSTAAAVEVDDSSDNESLSSIERFLKLFSSEMQHMIIRNLLDVSIDEVQLSQVRTLLKSSDSLFWDSYGSLMKIASTAGHFHLCNHLVSDLLQHRSMKLLTSKSEVNYANIDSSSSASIDVLLKPEIFDISVNLSIFMSYLIRTFDQQDQMAKGVHIMGLILQKLNSNSDLTASLVEALKKRRNSFESSSASQNLGVYQQVEQQAKLRGGGGGGGGLGGGISSSQRNKLAKFKESFDLDLAHLLLSHPMPATVGNSSSNTLKPTAKKYLTVPSLNSSLDNTTSNSTNTTNSNYRDDELLDLIKSSKIVIFPTIDFFESALKLCSKTGKHQLARKIMQYMEMINLQANSNCRQHTLSSFFFDKNFEEAKEWALLTAERLCSIHMSNNFDVSDFDSTEAAIKVLEEDVDAIISPILDYYWNNVSSPFVHDLIGDIISRNIILSNDSSSKYVKLLSQQKQFEDAVQFIEKTIRINLRQHPNADGSITSRPFNSSNYSSFFSGILDKVSLFLQRSSKRAGALITKENEEVSGGRSRQRLDEPIVVGGARSTAAAAAGGGGGSSDSEFKYRDFVRRVHLESLPLWHIVIQSSAEASNLDMTFWAFHSMRLKYDLRLDSGGWKSVIQLLCKIGKIKEAKDLMIMMVSLDDIIPSPDLWKYVLVEEGKAGDVITCLKTIEIMDSIAGRIGDDSLRPNSEHWNYVIESATRSSNPGNSLDLIRNLVEHQNVKLSENSYRLVLDMFRMKDQDKQVVDVLNMMTKYGVPVGENILHSLQNMKKYQNVADKINEIRKAQQN